MTYKSILSIVASLSIFASTHLFAKTMLVKPGLDTLQQAIDSAESGDVLLLENGGLYVDSDDIVVNKSLTIRARSKGLYPLLHPRGEDIVLCNDQAGPHNITLQGIQYKKTGTSYNGDIEVSNACAGQINILENRLEEVDIETKGSKDSTATINIVGNQLTEDGFINVYGFSSTYIAANNIEAATVKIDYANIVHVVGNKINCLSGNASYKGNTCQAIYIHSDKREHKFAEVYVMANEITLPIDASLNLSNLHIRAIRYQLTSAPGFDYSLTANNLIKFVPFGYDENIGWINQHDYLNGIYFDSYSKSGRHDVSQNLIIFEGDIPTPSENIGAIGTYSKDPYLNVTNNIIINSPGHSIFSRADYIADSGVFANLQFNNNICFQSETDCGTLQSNLNTDPLFADNEYNLDTDSPAIDAGYNKNYFTDLDKSRADIGLHGGPYGYQQYASQRQDSSKPYIFPFFNRTKTDDGITLNMKVLAISRLK